jgi:hypothetical protein
MRPHVATTAAEQLNEEWFTALALMFIARNIQPSHSRRKRGFEQGQPSSALQAIYGWRRVQGDCNRYLCDMRRVGKILKGLCAEYRAVWGDDAFVRHQAAIFSLRMLHTIADACEKLAIEGWSDAQHDVWLLLNAYLVSTGTRKDEWVRKFPLDAYTKRGNFCWVDAEFVDLPATSAVPASRRNGHYLRAMSEPSKCDRNNTEWGAQKQ